MKKLAIRIGIGAGILGIGVAIFYGVENYRGQKAWESYQQEAAALGEKLNISELVAPVSMDEANFAATPFFREVFKNGEAAKAANAKIDLSVGREGKARPSLWTAALGIPVQLNEWKQYFEVEDLNVALSNFSEPLTELAIAGERPNTRFPIKYEEGSKAALPHLTSCIQFSSLLTLRANVSLSEGKPKEALSDLLLIFRLAEAVQSDQLIISELVGITLISQALNVVWEGAVSDKWGEPELKAIKARLQRIDILETMAQSLRGDRAMSVQYWNEIRANRSEKDRERVRSFYSKEDQQKMKWIEAGPSGWLYQNQVTQGRFYQQLISALTERPIAIQKFLFEPDNGFCYHGFIEPSIKTIINVVEKAIALQSRVHQGIVAVALAEYRNMNGTYPSSLQELVPQFLPELPVDVLTGDPFVFKPTKGGYLLYAVGWNIVDDGGMIVLKNKKQPDPLEGDWVWFGSPQTTITKE